MPNWPCSRFLEPLKNNLFVKCSTHFGSLALVTIFQHPSTVSRCPRTLQNLCQTGQWKLFGILARCPRTLRKQPCRGTFVPFWSIWCQTWTGVLEPFKNTIFVRCSSHVGPFGAKLALVVILRHLSTVSQTLSNLFFVGRSSHFGPFGAKRPGW